LLSDRLVQQGAYLYGVRFGQNTHYLMIDIDRGSRLHPAHDPFAIGRVIDALEPLGLVSCVPIRSSYSDGIHLYFPFSHGQKSWAIAQAAESLIQSAGFKLDKGQVELFPNPRRCTGRDYNGHRLPLQQGSYLLDRDMEPVLSSRAEFVRRWRLAEGRNTLTEETLTLTLKQFSRQAPKKLRFSAQKFLNDLNADVEGGWTGSGQTNYILGRIAQREYVFFHALYGGSPLSGERLAARICEVAEDLPGYKQYCHHQYEMFDRCMEFARSIEHSGYYPYGGDVVLRVVRSDPKANSWNKQQASEARQRIESALSDMTQKGTLPSGIRNLLYAIKSYGVSAGSFYKNRDLWEGKNQLKPAPGAMIRPTLEEIEEPENLKPAPGAMIRPTDPISLYTADPDDPPKGVKPDSALRAVGGRGGLSTSTNEPPPEPPPVGIEFIRHTLNQIKQRRRQPQPPSSASSLPPPDESWFNQWRTEGTA
jgi:hypothetical protein